MTQEEIKTELREYRKICNECELLRKRLALKKNDVQQLRAVVSDGLPRSNKVSDTVGRAIEQIDGLTRYYASKIIEREESEMRVLKLIELAPDPDGRSILFLRYIDGKRFEDIAVELHLSNGTLWNRYNEAINKICSELE